MILLAVHSFINPTQYSMPRQSQGRFKESELTNLPTYLVTYPSPDSETPNRLVRTSGRKEQEQETEVGNKKGKRKKMGAINNISPSLDTGPRISQDVLLIHMPAEPDQEWVTKIEKQYPGFKVRWHFRPWNNEKIVLPREQYDGVTMLCAVNAPPVELPRLRYVQIASAGADNWINTSLYQNPNIVFCTANGTHPYVHMRPSPSSLDYSLSMIWLTNFISVLVPR